MTPQERLAKNERFLKRLLGRRPQDSEYYERQLGKSLFPRRPTFESSVVEEAPLVPESPHEKLKHLLMLETIVSRERPVLFVKNGDLDYMDVATLGPEAVDLVGRTQKASAKLLPLLPLIGRIDAVNASFSYAGTGWFMAQGIVVTNRHVAKLVAEWKNGKFVFRQGVGSKKMEPWWNNAHEFDDAPAQTGRAFKVEEVLYIEPDDGPNDVAFIKVRGPSASNSPLFIPLAETDAEDGLFVCVVGYPAWAPHSVIPDQDLMNDLYRNRFEIKRVAPGFTMAEEGDLGRHDCTTLGGNSGSIVLDPKSGCAVGLHFSGLYQEANYAVTASELTKYYKTERWNKPIEPTPEQPEEAPLPATTNAGSTVQPQRGDLADPSQSAILQTAAPGTHTVSFTVPLKISVGVSVGQSGGAGGAPGGGAMDDTASSAPLTAEKVEEAVKAFWRKRPAGVLAARVGYDDSGDKIGDRPCIAASVTPNLWPEFESKGPQVFDGVPLRYLPAEPAEQIDALPLVESVTSISYDDDARTGKDFSFGWVNEEMDVTLHVGPEYSWEVLEEFLRGGKNGQMVSAMYEFHAKHIKDALEARLVNGTSLKLVLDNKTFPSKAKADEDPPSNEFDRLAVFDKWAEDYKFERIVAPEGVSGLISDSYHIKVTVRSDDTFWLSSGNWKEGSSQPLITSEERKKAARGEKDLRGNREWHVVIQNKTLASRFRRHIEQDFERSDYLGAGNLPPNLVEEQVIVELPVEEAPVLERRAPRGIVDPVNLSRKVKVKPLLTPDRKGAIYSEAVLDLIKKAQKSLFFQIPYISMPPFPGAERGYIDELIKALTDKLNSLPEARLILRTGSSAFSSPTHAAWYFKSKGVDIDERVRQIENHHTKGMIVDGRRILVGSHNWSVPGVTLNRDASLIFDDEEVAAFYQQAFDIDWDRANPINPKKYVKPKKTKPESAVFEAPSTTVRRVPLSALRGDD